MRKYRAFTHPDGRTETVKQGWSWPAFFFGPFWALAKRMTFIGLAALFCILAVNWLVGALGLGADEATVAYLISTCAGLILGASGNAWREKHLSARGFVPAPSTTQLSVIGSLLRVQPFKGLLSVWHDTVWSKVIAAAIVGAAAGAIALFLGQRSPNPAAGRPPRHYIVANCTMATLAGFVVPNAEETWVWFDWGDTPELGNKTRRQLVTEERAVYQDIINLKENTSYWYTIHSSNPHGAGQGQVNSFTTAKCAEK